ncbi:uncharacterized protein RBU47_007269 isoform 1-T9 [Passerculus sandwichensis]
MSRSHRGQRGAAPPTRHRWDDDLIEKSCSSMYQAWHRVRNFCFSWLHSCVQASSALQIPSETRNGRMQSKAHEYTELGIAASQSCSEGRAMAVYLPCSGRTE